MGLTQKMSNLPYFTEIEMLQMKIKELEQRLEEERNEHRDIYMKMRMHTLDQMNIINEMKKECLALKEENMLLREELGM